MRHLLSLESSKESVIALPPSGLMSYYWNVVKKSKGVTIALDDKSGNILKRITFYDKDSKPTKQHLTADARAYYLREIKEDIAYFSKSYTKADISVDISGLDILQSALKIKKAIEKNNEESRQKNSITT